MPNCKATNRFERLIEYGCICCKQRLGLYRYPEIHHIVEGYRLGDDYTIPLCAWHHQGQPPSVHATKKQAAKIMGPNLRDQKKTFVQAFGSERELLQRINQWLGVENQPDQKD